METSPVQVNSQGPVMWPATARGADTGPAHGRMLNPCRLTLMQLALEVRVRYCDNSRIDAEAPLVQHAPWMSTWI